MQETIHQFQLKIVHLKIEQTETFSMQPHCYIVFEVMKTYNFVKKKWCWFLHLDSSDIEQTLFLVPVFQRVTL